MRKTSPPCQETIVRALPSSIGPQRWRLNALLYLHRASFKFAKETQIRIPNGETLDHLCRDRPSSACYNNLGDLSRHRRRFLPDLRGLAPTGCSTVRPLVLRLPAAQDERHSSREARMEPSPCQDCDAASRSSSEPPLAAPRRRRSQLGHLSTPCGSCVTMETQAPSAPKLIRQVAELANVSRTHSWRLVRRGEVDAVRVGGDGPIRIPLRPSCGGCAAGARRLLQP